MKSKINIIPNSNNNKINNQNESAFYRIIFIGDSGVGKTQIINIYNNKLFQNEHFPTFGIDFQIKTIINNGKKINIHCIDTEGANFFEDTGKSFLINADSFIFVYDITSRISFNNINQYYENIKFALNDFENNCKKKIIYLVGNKFDLKINREVNENEAKELGNKYNAKCIEVSAKNAINIDKLFEYLIQDINKRGEMFDSGGNIKNNNIYKNMINLRSNDKLFNTNKNDGQYNENESRLNYETSSYFLKTNNFINSNNDYINNINNFQENKNNNNIKKSFYCYEQKTQKCQIF